MEFEPPHIVLTRVAIPLAYQNALAVFNGMFWINYKAVNSSKSSFTHTGSYPTVIWRIDLLMEPVNDVGWEDDSNSSFGTMTEELLTPMKTFRVVRTVMSIIFGCVPFPMISFKGSFGSLFLNCEV